MTEEKPVIDWEPYFEASRDFGPSEVVLKALKVIEAKKRRSKKPRVAVDLGCGEGRDTIELLKRGWHVVAVDSTKSACERLAQKAAEQGFADRLKIMEVPFEEAGYEKADLITSFLALPYCLPEDFGEMWKYLRKQVKRRGYLSIHLFGDRHVYSSMPFISFFNRAQVDELFKGMNVIEVKEIERKATGADGRELTSHEFIILAQRK